MTRTPQNITNAFLKSLKTQPRASVGDITSILTHAVTTGEKEIPKIRADVFFRLKQGEFITYADGRDKKVQFKLADIQRELPNETKQFSKADLGANFERVYEEARSIFK